MRRHHASSTSVTVQRSVVVFTLLIAFVSAYHLAFFSTLLLYLPFVLFCIPALTALDAFYWPRLISSRFRQLRFIFCAAWCCFFFCSPLYPSSGPSSYLHPSARLPVLPSNQSYFLAANLYNSATLLPTWIQQLILLIDQLGPGNVFVSIYESNSRDGTKTLLRVLQTELTARGVRNQVTIEDDDERENGWSLNGHQRIKYMVNARNKALAPLDVTNTLDRRQFAKLVFFNDVYFDWQSIIRLLATKNGEYDLACAFDFAGVGLYDIWVTRDSCGSPTKEIWPYFSSDHIAIRNLRNDLPVEVASCWNGVAAFEASWFFPSGFTQATTHPLVNATRYAPTLPLRFRENSTCVSSECLLSSLDIHTLSAPNRPRIYMNPQVNVAYTRLEYIFYARLTHLSVVRPWRVVWEDWIVHRCFGWVADYFWLKEDDRCVDKGEWVTRVGCP